MNDKKHNGWTNYATWRVNLEIIDGSFGHDMEDAETVFNDIHEMAERMEDYVDDVLTDYGQLERADREIIALDYARAFVNEVNFHEIAEHVVENYPKLIKKTS